jgi:hypothetical protein
VNALLQPAAAERSSNVLVLELCSTYPSTGELQVTAALDLPVCEGAKRLGLVREAADPELVAGR